MAKDKRDVVQVLGKELEFLDANGYDEPSPHPGEFLSSSKTPPPVLMQTMQLPRWPVAIACLHGLCRCSD